jgi:hypothetical protein
MTGVPMPEVLRVRLLTALTTDADCIFVTAAEYWHLVCERGMTIETHPQTLLGMYVLIVDIEVN